MEPFRDFELGGLSPAYRRPSSSITEGGQYDPVLSPTDSNAGLIKSPHVVQEGAVRSPHRTNFIRPSFARLAQLPWTMVLTQAFALLWLVPIISIISLNAQGYIVGASADCVSLGGGCLPFLLWRDGDTMGPLERRAQLERRTHDILGGLQIVSKILEVWFVLICAWLVYLVTMGIAGRHGLPIGYLTVPGDFASLPKIFAVHLWTSLRRLPGSRRKERRSRKRIYFLVAMVVFLCGVCNLIGPGIAILLLPALQWVETEPLGNERYDISAASEPPSDRFWLWYKDTTKSNCERSQFEGQNFSCASQFQISLDAWAESYMATQFSSTPVSNQGRVSFTYNSTLMVSNGSSYEPITWSPNRRILEDISDDRNIITGIAAGYNESRIGTIPQNQPLESYYLYNNTVQTILHRNGPILGALATGWLSSRHRGSKRTVIDVDADKQVYCYSHYSLSAKPTFWSKVDPVGNYTRCSRVGVGWGDGYKRASFTIEGWWTTAKSSSPSVDVVVHSSMKAGYLPNGTITDELKELGFRQHCLEPDASRTDCDWDLFFNAAVDNKTRYRTSNVTTWEFKSPWEVNGLEFGNGSSESAIVALDFVVYQAFAEYLMDPSGITNPLFSCFHGLTPNRHFDTSTLESVAVDPTWALAAWAVDSGGRVDFTRSIAVGIRDEVLGYVRKTNGNVDDARLQARIDAYIFVPVLQMLSLIDFNVTPDLETAEPDPKKPALRRWGRVNVYAYGFSSRTSTLGLIVVSIACVVVVVEVVLAFLGRKTSYSSTDLLVSAMQHTYDGEFDGLQNAEKQMARVGFKVTEDASVVGGLRFRKVQHL